MASNYKSPKEVVPCDQCQVCGEPLPPALLDLGLQPMCDDLVALGDPRVTEKYPIEISLCSECWTGHQRYNIRKETLFPPNYHYRPRFTQDVLQGMQQLVEECQRHLGPITAKLACDIGCNDGSLLNFFRKAGAKTCGIEPTGAALEAGHAGHEVIKGYFSPATAEELLTKVGRPDIITFTNVFAHIEDLSDAIAALKILIGPESIIIIENHYLGTVLDTNQFDTFYHEHPRTYSRRSFEFVAKSLGGQILLSTFPKRYGGNIRVFIGGFQNTTPQVWDQETLTVSADEAGFQDELVKMQQFVVQWKAETISRLKELRQTGVVIHGKSFPGRAAILVTLLGLDHEVMPCVYERPGSLKIGHYLPGTRIEIESDDLWISGDRKPDALVIWAWHIAPEIAGYLRTRGYQGRIFVPLPKFTEIL